jgi:hypothetical protein
MVKKEEAKTSQFLTAKKLVDAGKPVPQPSVSLPPLVTPAGTSITLGPGPGQPAPVNPAIAVPVTNGAAAITNGSFHQTSSPGGDSHNGEEDVSSSTGDAE